MPPFGKLVPLPRRLTTDLPTPIAAGIGLAVSLPGTVVRAAIALPQAAVSTSVSLLGRYSELAELGMSVLRRSSDDEEDDPLPAYGMDTGAWGGADDDAEVLALLEATGSDSGTDEGEADAGEADAGSKDGAADEAVPDAAVMEEAVADERAAADDTAPEDAAADATLAVAHGAAEATTVESTPAAALGSTPAAQALEAAIEDRAEPLATAPPREELPIEGYDGLSAAALRARVSGLTRDELAAVRDYEAVHARRVTVLAMLERAIAKA